MESKRIRASLHYKLLAAYLVSTAMVVVGGAVCVISLQKALDNYQHDVRAMQAASNTVLHIQSQFKIQVQEWKNVLLRGKDAEKLDKYWKGFTESEAGVDKEANDLAIRLPEGQAKQKISEFIAAHRKMAAGYRDGLAAFTQGGFDPYVGDKAVTGIDRAPTALLNEAEKVIEMQANQASSSADATARFGMISGLITLLVTLAVGFFVFGALIRKSIVAPTESLVAELQRLADGKLASPVDLQDSGEIGLSGC